MNEKSERVHSHMFTLRVWVEDVGNGRFEYRGTLKHVLTGETHHFRGWPPLIRQLEDVFKLNQPRGKSQK
ncbi:MAG: hypothetical protein H6657_24370 [Ardenticatenaceae bacterium]|nr:hypothetical protein [Anaerolineales bacterium]MCB8969168.1 hypothetical protein [Ardenticatenaceae bacterium]MCB8980557.1 hypothetical protein [Ardenticatenaceae bacterium]